MKYYRIEQDSYHDQIRDPDPEDSWDDGDYEVIVYNVRATEVLNPKNDWDYDFAVPDEPSGPLYLLWASYTTGNSFGYTAGNFEAVMLHRSLDVAEENENRIWDHYERCREQPQDKTYSVVLKTDDGKEFKVSTPWIGFFESLTSIHIDSVK